MLKRANINWNAKQLVKMMEKDSIKFDNAVQRGLVWDDKRNSLLIHSMVEGYPIPPFYAAKNNGVYDFLDGKQRSNAILKFIRGDYALTDLPSVTLEDGTEIDISGMNFEELPEEIKDTILSYSLTVYYFEDITDDQITEIFARLNNGKPLTAIELTRVKAKSIETIRELGKHELFSVALTDKAINRYTNEDIVIKTWVMLNTEKPCLDTKVLRPITEEAEFTANDIETINRVFDAILAAYRYILDIEDDPKVRSKIAKRLITRTHLITVTPLVRKSLEENVSIACLAKFFYTFFSGKKGATNYTKYNNFCTSGSGHEASIANRLEAVNEAWDAFIENYVEEEEVVKPMETVEEVVETVEQTEEQVTEEVELTEEWTKEAVDGIIAELLDNAE